MPENLHEVIVVDGHSVDDTTSPPSSRGDGRLWGDGFEIETLIHMRVAEAGLLLTTILVEHLRASLRRDHRYLTATVAVRA